MKVIEKQKLFGNLKKCTFFLNDVTFLGYVVTSNGIRVDKSKVKAIRPSLIPKSIHDVRSFHELASVYRLFIRNFSSIIVMQENSHKDTQEVTKVKGIKNKRLSQVRFKPFLVPAFTLISRTNLEMVQLL